MSKSAYIIMTLGGSPGVLTELIWWLNSVRQYHCAGVEVWTTSRMEQRVREWLDKHLASLEEATHTIGDVHPMDTPPVNCPLPGIRIHVFNDETGPLQDVRSLRASDCVMETLHDRVRLLIQHPHSVTLIGCLAGGRKTLSTALQTAFSLQARPEDQLVHVLLHEAIEPTKDYAFPKGSIGDPPVPEADQVVVHEVVFPRIQCLVGQDLADNLASYGWSTIWPLLQANLGRNAKAILTRNGRTKWKYRVFDGDQDLYTCNLNNRPGSVLCAIIALHNEPTPTTTRHLVEWLWDHESEGFWQPRTQQKGCRRKDPLDDFPEKSFGTALNALRKKLADLPSGLRHFSPRTGDRKLGPASLDFTPSRGNPSGRSR